MNSFSILFSKHYSGDYVTDDEMGRECFMLWGEENCIQGFDLKETAIGKAQIEMEG
jgi:hypothetical protein